MNDLKTVALVAAGVMLAGYIMKSLYGSVPLIKDASDGFDM